MPLQPDRNFDNPLDTPLPDTPGTLDPLNTSRYGDVDLTFSDDIQMPFETAAPQQIRLPTIEDLSFDLNTVSHDLNVPEFDVNGSIADNLYEQSSTLPETEKDVADQMVDGIKKQRQTMRIVQENIGLNTDVVRAGIAQQKFYGTVVDYGTERIKLADRYVKYQTAGVNLAASQYGLSQAEEKLYQGQLNLTALEAETELLKEELIQKNALKTSRVADLRSAVYDVSANLDQTLGQSQSLHGA